MGADDPSDCPFNLYRVSGDISSSWRAVLANLEYVLPFLGEGGLHPPYPQGPVVRSRPGGWAYPDMLEVRCPHPPSARTLCPPPLRPPRT